jgi:hypothetical protein
MKLNIKAEAPMVCGVPLTYGEIACSTKHSSDPDEAQTVQFAVTSLHMFCPLTNEVTLMNPGWHLLQTVIPNQLVQNAHPGGQR